MGNNFINELNNLLTKYEVIAAIVAVSTPGDGREINVSGKTFVRERPRDHEEEILRDSTAKKACELLTTLLHNTYGGQ